MALRDDPYKTYLALNMILNNLGWRFFYHDTSPKFRNLNQLLNKRLRIESPEASEFFMSHSFYKNQLVTFLERYLKNFGYINRVDILD